ncbi:MAG: hypothetical protein JWN52_1888 [Actinomycetia bacterium]|nr:hypothetical protein [Actinomycetes bacterium]
MTGAIGTLGGRSRVEALAGVLITRAPLPNSQKRHRRGELVLTLRPKQADELPGQLRKQLSESLQLLIHRSTVDRNDQLRRCRVQCLAVEEAATLVTATARSVLVRAR